MPDPGGGCRVLPLGGLVALATLAGCSALIDLDPALKESRPLQGCEGDVDCNDDITCTHDFCQESDRTCVHFADHTLCSSSELCLAGNGCTPRRLCTDDVECRDDDPCNGQERCVDNACTSGAPPVCDDGVFCNGLEVCDPGVGCVSGAPARCLDGIDCTVDTCDVEADQCVHHPDDAACSDGAFCNGDETCSAEDGCHPGEPPCQDGVACSTDQCVESATRCLHHPDHELCGPDELCVLDGGKNPCRVVICVDDADCDDLNPCNGVESCGEVGRCAVSVATRCNDRTFCNGEEYCDEQGECHDQPSPSCSDGVQCTIDACDIGFDQCVHAPAHLSCSDGVVCNGAETCGDAGCEESDAPDCNDQNACTDDRCAEEMGGCVSTARDLDGDGHGDRACGGDDCDDSDEFVSPNETEVCNGVDDDCDLEVDEGFPCLRGDVGTCQTACASSGTRACSASCDWEPCVTPAEDCNGVDDDCDGQTDEGCDCTAGDSEDCTAACGTTGTRTCSGGNWSACEAPDEVCNGVDDDCANGVDDGFPCSPTQIQQCTSSCGTSGTRTCSGECAWGSCAPPPEVCNGMDDDCVGGADSGFACVRDSTRNCNTACATTGTQTCTNTCVWGVCNPPAEICNGSDDDCDGTCDEGFTCCAGRTVSCTTLCGSTGTATCSNGCQVGNCQAPAEDCYNGTDDDCDNRIDVDDPDCPCPCCLSAGAIPCL